MNFHFSTFPSIVLNARTLPWCPPARHLSASTGKPTVETPVTVFSTSAFLPSHPDLTLSRKVPSAPHLPVPPAPPGLVTVFPTSGGNENGSVDFFFFFVLVVTSCHNMKCVFLVEQLNRLWVKLPLADPATSGFRSILTCALMT